jgi:hypothetical protein
MSETLQNSIIDFLSGGFRKGAGQSLDFDFGTQPTASTVNPPALQIVF